MSCWPLIERELIQAHRRGRSVQRRFFAGSIAAGVTGIFLLIEGMTGSLSGILLHRVLFFVALYVAVFETGEIAAGLFVHERQDGTFGLLFLSGLSAGEVFVGKLFGAVAVVFYNLLAIVPVIAVPFFMGGVSVDLFLVSTVALPVLMLFALAAAVLASTISRDEGQAFTIALLLIVIIGGVPLLLQVGNGFFGAYSTVNLAAFSPGYAPYLIARGLPAGSVSACWQSLGVSSMWAAVGLAGSVLMLKHHWRIQVSGPRVSRWQTLARELFFGSPEWRRRLRAALLDINPLSWLVMRERRPVVFAVFTLGLCFALWLAG